MSSDYTRAHLNQFLDRRKIEGKVTRIEPSAKSLRHELVKLLREAAECSEEWSRTAEREWSEHVDACHEAGQHYDPGSPMEAAYIEHRLAISVAHHRGLRRDADLLAADFPVSKPLSKDGALEIATKAADAFIKREVAAGRFVPYNSEGRNAAAHAGLLALEEIEPGRWMVAAGDLDCNRMGSIFVTLRGGPT